MTVQDAPTESHPRASTSCPTCGAPAERGQLVCLECGGRIALSYRRPPSWKVPAAITAAIVLLAAVGAVLAYRALDHDSDREVASAPVRPKAPSRTSGSAAANANGKAGKPAKDNAAKPGANESAPAGADGLVAKGGLYSWPRSLNAFTVVLLSSEDRASAASFARSAAVDRPAKIGVIRSNDFKTLPKGFFVVFAGKYDSRAEADRAAARLGKRFRGAFTQLVKR